MLQENTEGKANDMYSYFKSEALKMRHTFAERLIIIAPMFTILLALLIMPGMYFQVECYNWFYSLILPGMISLGCTLVATKDQKMKNMGVISLPINLKKVWIAKILVCMVMIFIACFLLLLGTSAIGAITNYKNAVRIPMLNGFLGVIVLVVTFMWQIPICMFIGSKLGMLPTLLINVGAYSVFAIMAATESYWWIVPYSIPSRLMCPILKILPNGLPAVEESFTYKPELLSSSVVLPGVTITIILFLILTVITAKWYKGQEAK